MIMAVNYIDRGCRYPTAPQVTKETGVNVSKYVAVAKRQPDEIYSSLSMDLYEQRQ